MSLYASPLRVYLILGALALAGIYSGLRLPISLFPNSSKPQIWVGMSYGNYTPEEFLNSYGKNLEAQLRAISTEKVQVEEIEATYGAHEVDYDIQFKWGAIPNEALKEVQSVVNAFAGRLPVEIRDSVRSWLSHKNSGFFALTFYSDTRGLDELYDILEPILSPRIAKVEDAQNPVLWNPSSKEIRIELIPESVAALGLFPRHVEEAVLSSLGGRSGGSVRSGGGFLLVQMPRQVDRAEDLGKVNIPVGGGKFVHLSELARVDIGPKSMETQTFKTNGAPSLFLYARPKPGGNVKKMSEDLLAVVKEIAPTLPSDVQYRVLVDPSEFIRSAVNNVLKEVFIAALLAVFVLFLFIGSFRNVITAAIEIPLSMVLAFIMMRISGMNLNLISLGGLALSAGMNVDASVVVMENIFRHFEMKPGPHDFQARLKILTDAVKEVRFAIIASTIASLVVFLPLTFTSDLSYAILGDLALAVVFSHGLSAIVALLLVPTVRLQLMGTETKSAHHPPIERQLKWLENSYARGLSAFLNRPRLKWGSYAGLALFLFLLTWFVLPRLPKEIVGMPDTDWMVLAINTQGNTLTKQMESQAEQVERDLLREFGDKIQYTFTQVNGPGSATVMARLSAKRDMRKLWKAMEARFTNTPMTHYWVGPWNPSELPIPDPPQLELAVRGGTNKQRALVAKELSDRFQESKLLPRINTRPNAERDEAIFIEPYVGQWSSLRSADGRAFPGDLADLLRVGTTGRRIGQMPVGDRLIDVVLGYPEQLISGVEDVSSFPIGVGSKLVPLKALARVSVQEAPPAIFRKDERELFIVSGRENTGEEAGVKETSAKEAVTRAQAIVADWDAKRKKPENEAIPTVTFEEASKDLNQAIRQLSIAVGLSVVLIFLTLLIQFGSVPEALLVLVSVPLGFIGVLVSLFVFRSTLSLNSILGVILLNGIAVANSIILVDFIKRLVDGGLSPKAAALEAARERLRPILITSLTTVLGMLPIALGAGEGGRILQPLGIAVAGGLWISMFLTLFLVPAMQVSYLEWRATSPIRKRWDWLRFRLSIKGLPGLRSAETTALLLVALGLSSPMSADAAEEMISFAEAVRAIVERSTLVGSQKALLDATEARNLPSKLAPLPNVNLQGTYTKTGPDGPAAYTRRGVEATADMNIFKFGADAAAIRGASAEESAQESAVRDAELKAEAEGVRAIVTYVQTKRETETLKRIFEARGQAHKIAKERFERGLIASQESDKFEVDLDNTSARLTDAENAHLNSRAELEALLGHSRVLADWPWRERFADGAPTFPGSPDLSMRPDWQSAKKKQEAASHRANQAFGKVLPSLDVSFGYGYFAYEGFGTPPGATSSYEPSWRGTLSLTIPIFDRLANFGNYRAAVHQKASAEIDLERVRRLAKSEWESSLGTLDASIKTAKLRDRTLGISRQLYQDNLARFRRGLVNANELSVDQDRLYESELAEIRGWANVHTNFTRLCHAMGKSVFHCQSTP